jgi:hypothetical protein
MELPSGHLLDELGGSESLPLKLDAPLADRSNQARAVRISRVVLALH